MQNFLNQIIEQAKSDPKRIVFPEGFEPRILTATHTLLRKKTAKPVLIGNPDVLKQTAQDLCIPIEWDQVEVVDPTTDRRIEKWAARYHELREGILTEEEALKETQKNINVLGTLLVEANDADGMISGTTFNTAETIRPALQIIKTKEQFHKVSGFFVMLLGEKVLFFADCAVMIQPNSHELADIAMDTAETARRFGVEPKIAMLSFSTNGSAKHPEVDKVREATKMVKHEMPDLIIEGEMQVDAALVPDICMKKFPSCPNPGDFNVLIFPDLAAGNIAYKLVQRLAGAHAIGPILQGLQKPVNDLSRGCSAQDIVDLAAFTTVEAQGVDEWPTPTPDTLQTS